MLDTDTVLIKPSPSLGKEAKSVLRSCGWTDMVYDYMRTKKKLHAQEAGNVTSDETR